MGPENLEDSATWNLPTKTTLLRPLIIDLMRKWMAENCFWTLSAKKPDFPDEDEVEAEDEAEEGIEAAEEDIEEMGEVEAEVEAVDEEDIVIEVISMIEIKTKWFELIKKINQSIIMKNMHIRKLKHQDSETS